MKNSIRLDIDHFEKARIEYFLNNVDERLEQIAFDARELRHADDIIAGYKFMNEDQSTFVVVIIASTYFHADEICKANSGTRPHLKWTINGSILFGVESANEDVSNAMLSFFAGRE